MCKVYRVEHNSKVSFTLRRLDRSTTGIGSRYFNSIGQARNYADKIGLKCIN